jgi:RNA polymerase sigma-70 factor (ECF subfamily)
MAEETALAGRIIGERSFPVKEQQSLSEKEILILVKKGDRNAYQAIVTRYMRPAYSIALGFLHNQQDALDISQEAFIRAYRKLKLFDSDKPFFPWFYRLLKNLCLDYIKKVKRRNEVPLQEVSFYSDKVRNKELREDLWFGIEKLPVEQREVILLRYFRQLSYKEIAELVDKPIGTVMSSLYYAKKRLKEVMEQYLGYEHTWGDSDGPQ